MHLTGFGEISCLTFIQISGFPLPHLLDTDSFKHFPLLHQRIFWYLLCKLGKSSKSLEVYSSFSKLLSTLKQDLNLRVHGSQNCVCGSENRNEFKKEFSNIKQLVHGRPGTGKSQGWLTFACKLQVGRWQNTDRWD